MTTKAKTPKAKKEAKPKAADRHLNTQMVIWVPPALKDAFAELCKEGMSNASHEIRQFMAQRVKAGEL